MSDTIRELKVDELENVDRVRKLKVDELERVSGGGFWSDLVSIFGSNWTHAIRKFGI